MSIDHRYQVCADLPDGKGTMIDSFDRKAHAEQFATAQAQPSAGWGPGAVIVLCDTMAHKGKPGEWHAHEDGTFTVKWIREAA